MTAAAPQWISVAERLPPDGERVLVTPAFACDVDTDTYSTYYGCFLSAEIESGPRVTYWMPLPEPPK